MAKNAEHDWSLIAYFSFRSDKYVSKSLTFHKFVLFRRVVFLISLNMQFACQTQRFAMSLIGARCSLESTIGHGSGKGGSREWDWMAVCDFGNGDDCAGLFNGVQCGEERHF